MKSTRDSSLRREPSRVDKIKAGEHHILMVALRLCNNYLLLKCYDQPMFEAMVCSMAAAFEDITR